MHGFLSSVSNSSLLFSKVDEKIIGEPDWLYGSFQGKFGWFPGNYVEKIPPGEKAASPKKALLPPAVSLSATSTSSE